MSKRTNPLDHVSVAAPCPADWERMNGNEEVRFCAQCNLNVYNLSGMTRAEAEQLISHSEDRICIRFYRRADGTILTKNCPVGLRALKRRLSRMASAAAALVLSFFAGLLAFFGWHNARSVPERGYTVGVLASGPVVTNGTPLEESPPRPVVGEIFIAPESERQSRKGRRRK